MPNSNMNPKVDAFFREATQWRDVMTKLRSIILDCGLTEELKWSKPCYAFEGGNVVVIQPFKAYCALLFFKGVLLKDPDKILIKTGENTLVGRQIRFADVREVNEAILKKYIHQAVDIERAGLKVDVKKDTALKMPEEFQKRLAKDAALKKAFSALTPGRQRAYCFYFSGAKQSATRESRIKKYIKPILQGKGLDHFQKIAAAKSKAR